MIRALSSAAPLTSCATFLAAICSALAAYHWYRAAQVKDPPTVFVGVAGYATRTRPAAPNATVDASALVEYARESAKRNKTAALWSAAAAFFAFLAWGLGLFFVS
jgi:hypothetical protein